MAWVWFGASIAVVGCGPATPPPQTTTKPAPLAAKAETGASCATAARLVIKEMGFGAIPAKNQDRARRAGEAEVEAACLDDQWPDAVIQCASTRPSPRSCLGQLDKYQDQSLTAHLDDWQPNFTKGPGSRYGGDAYGGAAYGGNPCGGANPCGGGAPKEEFVPCESYGDVASYAPAIGAKMADRDYALAVRERAVHLACEMTWTNDDKKCFAAAHDAGAVAACRGKLAEPARNSLANMLADAETKFHKVSALERTPRAIECKAVATVHYSDEAWEGRLAALASADRKDVIERSRAQLATTCTAEKWPVSLRACLVAMANKEPDSDECFGGKDKGGASKWGFPAAGVMYKSGIPECDQLAALVQKIGACDKLDKDLRDELVASFGQQLGMWIEMPASSRPELVKQCAETVKVYTDGAKERGCTI
ncbi:MAG TPA: hypothetical protein VMJ10_26285 [Kofleriaceae bacterium]|nr:hypothetical protein [Kofleriaceae bacterium]